MKKLFLLFIIICCQLTIAQCQDGYWQQQVNVKIDVRLNDKDHTLDGFIKMDYLNNSPDTLWYIWMHTWPNAYKNDRTAFSDQLLENGRTDFYFSNAQQRGYINRLDFKVNGQVAKTEDHPEHQDILKVVLPKPLVPGGIAQIQTPFHVQLPHNFSRGGHVGQSYQLTQWYPKPAVYDRKGWHPMPYLDQGEFYSEFGNYDVQVTLPSNYVVAATGELQEEEEKKWLVQKAETRINEQQEPNQKNSSKKIKPAIAESIVPASSPVEKTIRFVQQNVHDFAWFADKDFVLKQDTLQLKSGRIIQVAAYWPNKPTSNRVWKNSISFLKQSILTRSKWLGEYPYNTATALEANMGFTGGMEYPTITSISPMQDEATLESIIEHEVGHNWNYGILASNERAHPWMDEGINSYYGERYKNTSPLTTNTYNTKPNFFSKRIPENLEGLAFETLAGIQQDQPIITPSDSFTTLNYALVAYYKTGQWLKLLEKELGTERFDSCMREYYRRWKFKHPYPEDFKAVMETVSGRNLQHWFDLQSKKGNLPTPPVKKQLRFGSFFNLTQPGQFHTISFAPVAGFNWYDKLMVGGLLHNYTLPAERFQFLLAPLYGTGSKQLNGLVRFSYHWFPGINGTRAELSLSGASFSGDSFTDSANNTTNQRFSKLVPSFKINFANNNPRSKLVTYLQWKTFLIREQGLLFTRDNTTNEEIISFPQVNRYVNQLRFVMDNSRVLYPYKAELQLEQGKDFTRLAFTGNYYFNYAKAGGMNVRVFAGKFFYLGEKTFLKQFETDRYHLNMTGPKGYEDYTYSNYYIGRNEYEKFPSQQIMQRDGFFKVRTDLLGSKIGKTDDWLGAINFTSDVPDQYNPLRVLPFKLPIKIFVDIGSYAGAWQGDAGTGKFIYDAGFQFSLVRNIINVYVPVLYSKVYRDYFKSTITEKRFLKNIAFSIDIQQISLNKLAPKLPL